MPILFRFNPTQVFYLEAGGAFNFNLISQYYNGYSDEWHDQTTTNAVNLVLALGTGFTLSFGLEFDFRFEYGLTDQFEHSDYQPVRLQFSIAYWFLH